MDDGGDKLLTLGAVAVRLGCGHWVLDKLARRGDIPVSRAGRLRLVRERDVEAVRVTCERLGYLKGQPQLTPA